MGIKRNTSYAEISRYIEERTKVLRQKCINNLIYVGEEAVKEARENGRYVDHTGNLRSSIGYCVLDNGKVINESGFKAETGIYTDKSGNRHPYEGSHGSEKGRDFLHRIISEHSEGLVLIVVAGMEYAAYVEAKNLNVLDSAEQLAERLLPQLMKGLKL